MITGQYTKTAQDARVCDNGPEFTSKALLSWPRKTGVKLRFIQPGKRTQNVFIERFNGKFRDACLNQSWFRGMKDARHIINDWRMLFNAVSFSRWSIRLGD